MFNLKNNMMAKLLSLVVAIFLWLYIINEENPMTEVNYTVPVTVVNLENNYLAGETPHQIKVRLRAPRNSFLGLQESSLQAYMDLSGLKEGSHTVPIKFMPPAGIYVERQDPLVANVVIDAYAERDIPLGFKAVGHIEKDRRIKDTEITPTHVIIRGARQAVERAKTAMVNIAMEGKKESFTGVGDITVADSEGRLIGNLDIVPSQGQAKVNIEADQVEKEVEVKPLVTGNAADGFTVVKVESVPAKMKVSGAPSVLEAITEIETEAIELDGVSKTVEKAVPLQILTGATTEATMVRVVITVQPEGENNAKNN